MIVGTICEIWRYPVKSMGGETLGQCTVLSSGVAGDRGWAVRDEIVGEIRGAKRWPKLMQCSSSYSEEPSAGKTAPAIIRLPDGSQIASDHPNVYARLSDLLEQPVTLWPIQPASNKAHYRRAVAGARLIGIMGGSRMCRRVLQRIIPFTSLDAELREFLSREPDEALPDLADHPPDIFEFTSPPGSYFDAFPINILTTASLRAMARISPSSAWDVRRFRPNFLVETDASVEGLVESDWRGKMLRIGGLQLKCEVPTVRCGMTMHAQADLVRDPNVLRTIVRAAGQHLGVYASVVTEGSVSLGDTVEVGA